MSLLGVGGAPWFLSGGFRCGPSLCQAVLHDGWISFCIFPLDVGGVVVQARLANPDGAGAGHVDETTIQVPVSKTHCGSDKSFPLVWSSQRDRIGFSFL